MKKLAFLLAMVLGTINMYAQDYDLQRLAKICKEYKIISFSEGLICCMYLDLGHVFFNTMGEKVIEIDYVSNYYPYFSDGLIVVGGGDNEVTMGKYGYADKSGKIVIPYKYDDAEPFYKGIAKVSKDGRQFYIDKKGKECFDKDKQSEYDEGSSLSKEIDESGLIMVENNGKYGWKNEKGDIVIPIQYDMAMDFHEGLAMVTLNAVVGFVDKYGNSTFNPPSTINTPRNTAQETKDNLEEEVKALWYEADKYIELVNDVARKEEMIDNIKKADALYEKIQNIPGVESVLSLDFIKQRRDFCKQFIEKLNTIK